MSPASSRCLSASALLPICAPAGSTLPDSAIATPPRRTVRARHAASLVVLRQGAAEPEMLMGMRGARHRFMPNRLVFPGGAVDAADLRRACATPLLPHTRARLEKAANPALAHGLAVAAARELQEETGLTLGDPPALDALEYLCRLITPPGSPIRFNARFLLVDAAHARGTHRRLGRAGGFALLSHTGGDSRSIWRCRRAW